MDLRNDFESLRAQVVMPWTVPMTLTMWWPGRVSVVAVRTELVRQWGSDSGRGEGRYVMVEARWGLAIMERRLVNILVGG